MKQTMKLWLLAAVAFSAFACAEDGEEAFCLSACQHLEDEQTCAYSYEGGGLAGIAVFDSCLPPDAAWDEAACTEACMAALSPGDSPLDPALLPRLRSLLDCTSTCDNCAYCEACGEEAKVLIEFVWHELGGDVVRSEDLACGPQVELSFRNRKTAGLLPLAAVPLVERDGELQRACQFGPDDALAGLELAFVWRGTQLATRCEGGVDRDLCVMPGDYVEVQTVIAGDNFSEASLTLDLACVDASPSASYLDCDGLTNPSAELTQLAWRSHQGGDEPARCEPVAVALLIDQSGSMSGFVNADQGWREDVQGSFAWPSDLERQQRASDPHRHRIGAAQDLISQLNAEDHLVVFSFQERLMDSDLQVLCEDTAAPPTGELADKTELFRKAVNCFGTNRAPIEAAVGLAYGEEEGRTPLWTAVLEAYEFLRDPAVAAPANRHLIVIGDGPDTCNGSSDEFLTGQPQCGAVSYEELREHILATNEGAGDSPVHVHFIQMQAWGYPDRDPRQQELACLTGGQHVFIDGFDMPRTEGTPELAEALEAAVKRIRYALAGHWTLRAEVPAFGQGASTTDELPPGSSYAVSGTLRLLAGDFTSLDKVASFDASGSQLSGGWDHRLWFRHRCTDDSQCAGDQTVCSEQQGLCLAVE